VYTVGCSDGAKSGTVMAPEEVFPLDTASFAAIDIGNE